MTENSVERWWDEGHEERIVIEVTMVCRMEIESNEYLTREEYIKAVLDTMKDPKRQVAEAFEGDLNIEGQENHLAVYRQVRKDQGTSNDRWITQQDLVQNYLKYAVEVYEGIKK